MEERLKTYLRPGEQVRWQGRPAPFSLLEAEAKKQILLKWGLTVALGGGLLAVYLSRTEAPSMGFIGLVLLYLPLNWYNGGYGPAEWVKKLLLDGTFYHLWYFPGVILGVLVARGLLRLGPRTALTAAGLLYLVGLGGDSYYGLTCQLPALEALYGGIFQIFAYTRNGLFFTPLFLLLGAAGVRWSVRTSAAGLCAAFAAMTAEGLWLHGLQVQRHDSMYMLLPLVMVCLFSLLLGLNRGERRSCRKLSSLIYVLHPWCIVLVRGGAEVLGLEGPLVENSMGHFLAVLASSAAASWALWLAWSRRPLKRSNKG